MASRVRIASILAPNPGLVEAYVNEELAALEREGQEVLGVQVVSYPDGDVVLFAAFITFEEKSAVGATDTEAQAIAANREARQIGMRDERMVRQSAADRDEAQRVGEETQRMLASQEQ